KTRRFHAWRHPHRRLKNASPQQPHSRMRPVLDQSHPHAAAKETVMIRELFVSAVIGVASMLGPLLAHQADAQTSAATILAFDTMYGVDGPFVHHKLRGVVGDDLPWEIESATGALDTTGHITIAVRGLVFTDDPEVPANLRGTNDAAEFRAGISCVTEVGNALKRKLVVTSGFAATPQGDA